MPDTRVGKTLAAAYLLLVSGSSLVWAIQGAYSPAVWLTLALTLPWSPVGYILLYVAAGLLLIGSSDTVQTAGLALVVVLLFTGLAVANVVIARAVCRVRAQSRLRRESIAH